MLDTGLERMRPWSRCTQPGPHGNQLIDLVTSDSIERLPPVRNVLRSASAAQITAAT